MDLNTLDVIKLANEGTVLELLHPATGEVLADKTEEYEESVDKINSNDSLSDDQKAKKIEGLEKPKPFYLRLLGSDSDTYRNAMKRRFERNQNKKNQKINLDDAQIKAAELLAKCTTDCFMIEDGKAIVCNHSEMTRLYLKYPWMREQAEEAMADRSVLMTK